MRLLRFGQADFPLYAKFFILLLRPLMCGFHQRRLLGSCFPHPCHPLQFLSLWLHSFCHTWALWLSVSLWFDLRRPSPLKPCHSSFSSHSDISLWIHCRCWRWFWTGLVAVLPPKVSFPSLNGWLHITPVVFDRWVKLIIKYLFKCNYIP